MRAVGPQGNSYNWVKVIAEEAVQASEVLLLRESTRDLRATIQQQAAIIKSLETTTKQALSDNNKLLDNANLLVTHINTLVNQGNGQAKALATLNRNIHYTYIAVSALAFTVIAGLIHSIANNYL